jgi:alkylation response protein AidB-like acyl-CoA dehydrogenase
VSEANKRYETPKHPIFTPEHDELRATIRRFVDTEVRPNVVEWERAGLPNDLFRRCGELGFFGLHYPTEVGGSGGDLASGVVFVEELARCGAAAVAMALSVQSHMATPALAAFGTSAQQDRWLRPALAGELIAAIAITEPDAGSDVAAITTRATRDGNGWRIRGSKMFITNGARADFLTLVARTGDPDSGHRGISLFALDTTLPGVDVSRTLEKLGMHASDTALIALDDVPVPAEALIGMEPNRGFTQLMQQLQHERLAGAAASVGHASDVLERTIAYASERHTFGKPLAGHQAIAHKLADAATELEAARQLLHGTTWRLQQGEYPVAEISMTKKYAAQVQQRVVDACLQVWGGAGYLEETGIARAYRDARLNRIGGGADEILNDVIAKRLFGTSGQP